MITPTWFLFITTVFLITMGLVNILSHVMPAHVFKIVFKDILLPTVVIVLIFIVFGIQI